MTGETIIAAMQRRMKRKTVSGVPQEALARRRTWSSSSTSSSGYAFADETDAVGVWKGKGQRTVMGEAKGETE